MTSPIATSELANFIRSLNIHTEDFEWHHLAACDGVPWQDKDPFFEEYEVNKTVAREIDNLCLTCPVLQDCFRFGQSSRSSGVFGGFYMVDGEPKGIKNSHKTKEISLALAERIYGDE